MGDYSHQIFIQTEEQKRNLLKSIYMLWRNNQDINIENLSQMLEISSKYIKIYLETILQEGYLLDCKNQIKLSDLGKSKGKEIYEHHNNLAQFLEIICGVDEKTAKENSDKIEQVAGNEILEGITNFLHNGNSFDKVVKNSNLQFLYDDGIYDFNMSIYSAKHRYPRVLDDMFYSFIDKINLTVSFESYFSIYLKNCEKEEILWYKSKDKWEKITSNKGCFNIPTSVFEFTINNQLKIYEGVCMIAFCDNKSFIKDNCKELNVHMW